MTAPLPRRRRKYVRTVTAADLQAFAVAQPGEAQHLEWWMDEHDISAPHAVEVELDVAAKTVTARYRCMDDRGRYYFDPDTGSHATHTETVTYRELPPFWPCGYARRTA